MIENGGFLAIGARDLRSDGKLIPYAKLIVDELKSDRIWLKEIIIVSEENDQKSSSSKRHSDKDNQEELQISHSYILVYEKKY